jgi:transcriptional regulator with XRE-family HTH domain
MKDFASMIQDEIGRRIQKAREEAGLSQEELASRLGLTQAALSNYELGKRRPNLTNLERLSMLLNKPLLYFLEDPKPMPDPAEEERLDESIYEMISLLGEMPEDERKYLLDFIRWRREQQRK